MEAWGLTDPGSVRKENQDAFLIQPLDEFSLLAVVCDGMGGARSGSVASGLACEVFVDEVLRSFSSAMTPEEVERTLRSAATLANISVFEHSQLGDEFSGMGTTLVACLLYPQASVIINVGDSRAYRIDSDGIVCITTDHSVVQMMVQRGELTAEQAKAHPSKNLITRAIGTGAQVFSDVYTLKRDENSNILLCSDGLSNEMADQEILFEVLHGERKDDCCQRLLQIVKERGAPDNVTAVLLSLV